MGNGTATSRTVTPWDRLCVPLERPCCRGLTARRALGGRRLKQAEPHLDLMRGGFAFNEATESLARVWIARRTVFSAVGRTSLLHVLVPHA